MFQIVTNQDMKDAFNRQHRETERTTQAEQQRADLKAEIQGERNAYVRMQTDERQRLVERHKAEDRQLNEAVEQRRSLDRVAEVHARQAETRSNSRQQERDQDQGRGGRSIEGEIPPP